MSVFRRGPNPSIARRLGDLALSLGILVLVVGLVCAFVVAGVYGVHASLSRNADPNADRVAAQPPPAPAPARPAPRPAPPPPTSSADIAVAEPPPPPPPPKPSAKPIDPSRMDDEGFIKYWLILGPIPADKEFAGAAEIHAPRLPDESSMRPRADQRVRVKGKDLVWQRHRTSDYAIDFKKALAGQRGEDALVYAVTYVHSPEERREVKLFIGTNDQGKVWLNGKEVLVHDKSRSLKKDNDVVAGLTLRKGENVLVLKIANERGNWEGCARFGDKAGMPMVDLQLTSTPR